MHSPYFKTNIIDIDSTVEKKYSLIGSFIIYMCVEGSVSIISKEKTYTVNIGETLLLPSSIKNAELKSENAKILEVYY